jgi:ubiquitin thioesterase protein OTUB1
MSIGGYQAMTFEDFAEETFVLLKEVSDLMDSPDHALAHVMQKLNDASISDPIVYHLRMLAASYMKGNAQDFADFVPDGKTVDGYCADELERPGQEIEQMGIMLLVEILLKPVNFIIEIAMLDRSEGAEVNTYRFPAETTSQDPSNLGPIIYLLYRPGHYDILYKDLDGIVPVQLSPVDVAANFVTFPTMSYKWLGDTMDPSAYASLDHPLFMIPGFAPPPTDFSLLKTPIESPNEQAYTSSPVSVWMPSGHYVDTFVPQLEDHTSALPSPPQSVQSVQLTTPVETSRLKPDPEAKIPGKSTLPSRRRKKAKSSSPQTQQPPLSHQVPQQAPHQPQSQPTIQGPIEIQPDPQTLALSTPALIRNPPHPAMTGDSLFRVSAFSIRSWNDHAASMDPGGLSPIYQNSHFNTAHFNNPNFQPEEYCPGIREDGTVARSAGLRKRSRSPVSGRPLPFRKRSM